MSVWVLQYLKHYDALFSFKPNLDTHYMAKCTDLGVVMTSSATCNGSQESKADYSFPVGRMDGAK
jgi:hypothetical protein